MKYFNTENLSAQEIKDNLEAEAYQIEEGEYFRPFTEEEMMEVESTYVESSKEVQQLEDEKKRLLEPIQEKLKDTKAIEKEFKRKVTDGGENQYGKIYLMIDRDNRQVVRVNERGEIIGNRAMTAKERQLFIMEGIKKIG